ncbi:hypothetical protein AAFF_G00049990 [Aldrovandia affinis]|uniref:Uncharacterized protein n=1 Tax=Aldrovandia affinis TaxID=143900 RepID=A0AAD7S1B6_9TELE|nr:hypothetical protein AAFF_G00049990 [Aldrovandia affinis]
MGILLYPVGGKRRGKDRPSHRLGRCTPFSAGGRERGDRQGELEELKVASLRGDPPRSEASEKDECRKVREEEDSPVITAPGGRGGGGHRELKSSNGGGKKESRKS